MKPDEERKVIKLMLLPIVFCVAGWVLAMVLTAAALMLRVLWYSFYVKALILFLAIASIIAQAPGENVVRNISV